MTQAFVISYYYTTEKSAFTSGKYSSKGPYIFLCFVHTGVSNGALNQDREVKQIYAVVMFLNE